jgi:hypothetical protein
VLLILAGLFLLFGRGRFRLAGEPLEKQVFQWTTGSPAAGDPNGPAAAPDAGSADAAAAGFQSALPGDAWAGAAPGEIRRLVFRSIGEMNIRQVDGEGLMVEASEALKSRVRSRVEGGTLEIWMESGWWDWLDFSLWGSPSIRYELAVRSLEGIHMAGAGSIRADRLSTPRLDIHHAGLGSLTIGALEARDLSVRMSGMGSVEIKGGQVENQVVSQQGAGSYQSGRLASRAAKVSLQGLGSATVWAADTLDAEVRGLGSIEYFGSPQVTKSLNGLGSINARGTR